MKSLIEAISGSEPLTEMSVMDWELYDQPGAGAAARKLTAALNAAKKQVRAGLKGKSWADTFYNKGANRDIIAVVVAAHQEWRKVAKEYASFGALDSEPVGVAAYELAKVANSIVGGNLDDIRYAVW